MAKASAGGRLVATAARAAGVRKMFVIDTAHQGGGALGALADALIRFGRAAGEEAFFVFTRPEHAPSFAAINFRLLAVHAEAALLEYGGGLAAYLAAHAPLVRPGRNGASVVNGNPFTFGHQYLVETASRQVDTFYLFVVREDRSIFPFAARYRLAAEATAHLPNVVLLDTSRYAVSAATFPTYFLRRLDDVALLYCRFHDGQPQLLPLFFHLHIGVAGGIHRLHNLSLMADAGRDFTRFQGGMRVAARGSAAGFLDGGCWRGRRGNGLRRLGSGRYRRLWRNGFYGCLWRSAFRRLFLLLASCRYQRDDGE